MAMWLNLSLLFRKVNDKIFRGTYLIAMWSTVTRLTSERNKKYYFQIVKDAFQYIAYAIVTFWIPL